MTTTTEQTDDIHSLELDFAKHPHTDAFVPLCEAYLRSKRYMEAMLVCKKGIKNLPNDPRGRLLLARVYLEQGKPPKAEQELTSLLEIFPDNIDALVMQSDIWKSAGRKSDAIMALQRAMMMQPGRADLKDALKALGVEVDTAPPPPPPMQQQQAMHGGMMPQSMGGAQSFMQTSPVSLQQDAMAVDSFFEEAQPIPEPTAEQRAEFSDMPRRPKKKKKGGGKVTLAIMGVLLIGLGSFLAYYLNHVGNVKKIDTLIREARPNLDKATYVGYRAALEKYGQIVDIDPNNVFALSVSAYIHYLLSASHLIQESAPLAARFLERAEVGGPETENQYRVAARGWKKIAGGDPKGAVDFLAPEAPKVQSAHVYTVLAEAYAQLGEDAQAREAMNKASQMAAADPAVMISTGEHNMEEGKYDAAKGYFDQTLANEVGHPGALIGRAYVHIGKKQESLESAAKDLEKLAGVPAEMLTPRWRASMTWAKAIIELRRGKTADAQRDFDESLKLDPANMRNFGLRAKVYASMKMWPEAVKDYQTILAKKPNHRASQVGLALAYSALGKSVEAGQIVEQLLAKDPNDVDLQMVKADALLTQNKLDEALPVYEKVLALQKTSFDAKLAIGQVLRMKKDFAKAEEHLNNLLKESKGKHFSAAAVELGRVQLDQGSASKAKEMFTEALKKDPDYPDTYFFFGKTLSGKAKSEAMKQYLKLAPTGKFAAEAEKLAK